MLEIESIDRMYLNGYVPGLQTEGSFGATSEACRFLQGESPCLEFKGMSS
jgi:hypothetical protein